MIEAVVFAACCLTQSPIVGSDRGGGGGQLRRDAPRPVLRTGKWGYVDVTGNIVIEPRFEMARDFVEERAAATTTDISGYIDLGGRWVCQLRKGAIPGTRFSSGRAWFLEGRKYGCIDVEGKQVVAAEYDFAGSFCNGLAPVMKRSQVAGPSEEKWGYIDKVGNVVIALTYAHCSEFSGGIALVRQYGQAHRDCIDTRGAVVFSLGQLCGNRDCFVSDTGRCFEGRIGVRIDPGSGARPFSIILDAAGQRIGAATFDHIGDYSDGLVAVRVRNKTGYVDRDGQFVISPRFDEGGQFHDGMCRVRVGAEWHFVDQTGESVIRSAVSGRSWNDAEDFLNGMARVHVGGTLEMVSDGPTIWRHGTWYYIDRAGRVVAECRKDEEWEWWRQSGRFGSEVQ